MSDLAYMTYSDWGDKGEGMARNSLIIREWLGQAPYIFAVKDARKFDKEREADHGVAEYLAAPERPTAVLDIGDLGRLEQKDPDLLPPLAVLHPYTIDDCDSLRRVHAKGALPRTFVMVFSPRDPIGPWLASAGALNLATGERAAEVDPLMLKAAKMMANEAYNGLSSGRGKDVVVTLVRALAAEGYPADSGTWLPAYYRAGGNFRHAVSIDELIREMNKGVTHRVKSIYRPEIVSIMREQLEREDDLRVEPSRLI